MKKFFNNYNDFNKAKNNLITNMDASKENIKIENTEFIDEGVVISRDMDNVAELPAVDEGSDIKNFLGTPRQISTYVMSNQGPGDEIFAYPVSDFFALSDVSAKLKGRGLIRGKFCMRVVVNANPFQAGLLMLRFLPLAEDRDHNEVLTREIGLMTMSQQPCEYFTLADSGVEMKMPYVSPLQYYDINLEKYCWGTFFLNVVTPLRTGVTALIQNADLSIWVWMEDIELAQPMVPNARFGNTTDREKVSMADGSLSRALRTVSKVAKGLTAIPALAAYAGPTAWVADRLAGIASEFGYSKPPLDKGYMPVNGVRYRHQATSDGQDDSIRLGLKTDNRLSILTDVTPHTEDEMSWNFLKSRQFFFKSYIWETSATYDIFGFNVSPTIFALTYSKTSGPKTLTYKEINPIYSLSRYFNAWRGSIKFTVKFVKTQYHSGRAMLIWQPGNTPMTTPSIPDSTYCMREIIDLRYSDEVSITLPWVIAQNYISMSETSGRFSLIVVNNLKAPDSVADTIDIVLIVSGGEDLEYMGPYGAMSGAPLITNSRELPSGAPLEIKGPVTIIPAAQSAGEYFSSLKQIINRTTYCTNTQAPASTTSIKWCPWYHTTARVVTGVFTVPDVPTSDMINHFGNMFTFYRGAMRVQITNPVTAAMTATLVRNGALGTELYGSGSAYPLRNLSPEVVTTFPASCSITADVGGVVSFLVPYYNDTRCTLLSYPTSNLYSTMEVSTPEVAVNFSAPGGAISAAGIYTARSAGEDFQYSYFVGCLPLFVSLV